jgi:hypothetical protein
MSILRIESAGISAIGAGNANFTHKKIDGNIREVIRLLNLGNSEAIVFLGVN